MDNIRIFCENDRQHYEFPLGTSLQEMAAVICPDRAILAALVDNQLKELRHSIIAPHIVNFIGYDHAEGRRTYIRSLCFVLQKAVRELYPENILVIDYSLPSGLYCEIREKEVEHDGRPKVRAISDEEISRISDRMKEIIDADMPFSKAKLTMEDALALFEANGQPEKVNLVHSLGRILYSVYYLDGLADTFHGPLVPSTGCLKTFDLVAFSNGFCLQYPLDGNSGKVLPMKRQSRIAAALKEHSDWCAIMGVKSVGALNKVVQNGGIVDLINLSEALHERKYAEIANMIYARKDNVKIVFIAGPSSSGKTSTSKRLAIQCRILGLNPKVIELDNYFVDREHTPKDENGEYDFEALGAMDLKFLGQQLNDLLDGKEVEIPKFNFKTGQRCFDGNIMKLEEKDILIMEGIHALNPAMIPDVDQSKVFRVYASALTSLSVDENNNISTADNRLMRRMIRDNRTRGMVPEETIMRWASVRRGENRNIFPFQENADAIFNSAHIFELPVLKYYAEPLLRRILPSSPAYTEATRILKFLSYIIELSPAEIAAIPPTSILREFIGGQTL
jgi:uridine kinase